MVDPAEAMQNAEDDARLQRESDAEAEAEAGSGP